ncbi:hypothetical protein AYO21_09340 [Fonsecaea monophora]|uniref:Uncharacterized protein n=2 Tax=Fonsecaea TaxID=40354 RepID=A0A0D2DUE8_9EURO|nr:uncharacterized protein Z517_04421 [Fonsecaea pedrosoi CBS 271.37]XP_022508399.1 hypothetical protein AYO21_09340 [Fonsecaea monophora]KAH0847450.1 hypothetical protein FOPE_00649 [Fonsecaea pedrosoi]KIW81396.1 hypothetical protein Z517_04421 [Fonsecaea pedrosoi CBS 271.37]OAG36447.1 hypothetical protein AYO21_09340 [Fonsecaea monophora]
MPEVVRGSRASFQVDASRQASHDGAIPTSPLREARGVHFGTDRPELEREETPTPGLRAVDTGLSTMSATERRKSREQARKERKAEPERDAYYDSRAATKREFRRRASTLQDYYTQHPTLLPQLPFTWRHGWRRWKLFLTIFTIIVDACIIPIVLFYTMKFAGHVEGWIIFAVVATIWGGPTYVEFAVRTWRLFKKENFFRPLGTSNRWAFDITNWISVLTITVVTALLIVGSAPHIVWLRVLSLPAPALLFCITGCVFILTMFNLTHTKAPFRISSTEKGAAVYPGAYYLIEDVVAVNANAGRPFREALAARYRASPRFRRMILVQSLFWSIPGLLMSIGCIVVVCIHPVPKDVGYGIGWGVPFVWVAIWVGITIPWVRRDMHKETVTWEEDCGIEPGDKHHDEKKLEPTDSDRETTKEQAPDPEP